MEEEQCFDQDLQQVERSVEPAHVGQLVGQEGLEVAQSEPAQERARNHDGRPRAAQHHRDVDARGEVQPRAAPQADAARDAGQARLPARRRGRGRGRG